MNNLQQVKSSLEAIGYRAEWFSESVGLWTEPERQVALVAHSRLPRDLRTAAFAVYEGDLTPGGAFPLVRATGAALVIGISRDGWRASRVGQDGLHHLHGGKIGELGHYLGDHAEEFNPDAIYRAKVWGRLDPAARQLDFVDIGLMAAVEQDMGRRLSQLLEECVHDLAGNLGWTKLGDSAEDDRKAEWLIKAPFWLLAAKTLRDKRVPGFVRVNLGDFGEVFPRLAKHYRSDRGLAIQVPANRQQALAGVSRRIEAFASLELLSAEALGHIYEDTLINKATRRKLGTHSTPPWLIDYIIGRLKPWIEEMPVARRVVFEPACGHAGFLVAALRLLDELRPADYAEPRNSYLRKRLHGVDVDPFSQEVARLALTLADVPNPNGWNLAQGDIFTSDVVARKTRAADIVLMNPPFESFGGKGERDWLPNKAAETLRRVVENLKPGAVLGFVGPQGILQNKQARAIRRELLEHHEIREVVLFADKVFEFGEPESTVILARKRGPERARTAVAIPFVRVREGAMAEFKRTQEAGLPDRVGADQLLDEPDCPLFAPQLVEVWRYLRASGLAVIGDLAEMGQGLTHKGEGDFVRESEKPFSGGVAGFAGWLKDQVTHELPKVNFLNLNPRTLFRKRHGVALGTQQVLVNYARVSRGPWRLKALIDEEGHPVTSRFIVVRPAAPGYSLPALWALLNSPLANAFAFCHLSKRDNLVGTLRKLPIPDPGRVSLKPLEAAATAYLKAARRWSEAAGTHDEAMALFHHSSGKKTKTAPPTKEELHYLHLRVDVEVMKLYALPPALERKVLDTFAAASRKGVPFDQCGYFPFELAGLHTVADLVTVLADWEPLAERKSALVRKKAARKATAADLVELAELKRLSVGRLDLLAPLPLAEAEAAYQEAVRRAAMIHPD
ncbi:MAG: SAM-dependent methyltransferase [Akkermansiaceae bacterium]|nr:SAM-dependent methyltransferase [Akkermansiaceae bacterium]